jgi:hypothetical protein
MWKPATYTQDRFDDMIDMSIENFGTDNDICDKRFIQHQYFENPAGNALIEFAVDPDNNVLAGQYVVNPARFRCFGKDVMCVTSLNTLTREAYRGQKIFVKLAEMVYGRAAEEGFEFVYGAPNQNSHHGFIARLNFDDITEFPLYMRPLVPSKMVKEYTSNSILETVAKPFNVFCNPSKKRTTKIVKLKENNVFHMDEFWEKIKDCYPVMGIRNAEYIRWRYLTVPRRKYYPYVAVVNNKVVAFAVGRIREVSKFNAGMIADFLYLEGFEKEAGELINALSRMMKADGASLAGCIMLSHTKEAHLLTKTGFFKCPDKMLPQPTPLILRVLDKDMNNKIKDINNWFFTTGDYDVV